MDTETMLTIQNTCACVTYNEATGDWDEAPECWGDCWSDMVDDFADAVHALIGGNTGSDWRIEGFPVWHGTVDGVFTARTHQELLERITPNRTEWILRYKAHEDHLECVLSHHDAPTGGRMIVTPLATEGEVK
ncbi:hypothetical protein EBT31_14010 [bacterium]|jgi:hypothetical protein|nr:hypothetical protein [bacterium]